jgi:bacteriocin biosynthesis cyclodehydratase domain-containing protein
MEDVPAGRLRWSKQWTVETTDSALVVSAGADRQVGIDGLTAEQVASVQAWASGSVVEAEADDLLRHLVQLGVLVPAVVEPSAPLHTTVVATHPAAELLADSIGGTVGDADLVVVVRCGTGAPVDTALPRLIVDVGAEHTVVFGPFVVPGITACETCLDRLLARRWAASPQPSEPRATLEIELVTALTRRHLDLIRHGVSPLVNTTIAFDMNTMTSTRNDLLMSPGCPTCALAPPGGRLELPWVRS